jgi:hypothetical protein
MSNPWSEKVEGEEEEEDAYVMKPYCFSNANIRSRDIRNNERTVSFLIISGEI